MINRTISIGLSMEMERPNKHSNDQQHVKTILPILGTICPFGMEFRIKFTT
jgi:hypothetical protein